MKSALVLIPFLLFAVLASAALVEIEVKMETRGDISALFLDTSKGVFKLNLEFYNTGSVGYKARTRLEISNSTDLIFTGWSREETVMPGERKNFETFWYSPSSRENLTAKVRVYYGRETIERQIPFDIENPNPPEDVFQIKNFRTYDDYIRFEIKSSKSLSKVLVMPSNYMSGWIFEQSRIEKIGENRNIEVKIKYDPAVWLSHKMDIEVANEDGRYYSVRQISLERESGLLKYIHYITDGLSVLLNL